MINTTDNRLTDFITGPDDRVLSEPAITTLQEGTLPVAAKRRLRLHLKHADPQAKRVMAICNVLMYFVPVTMIATGVALAFVSPVLALFYLLPAPVLTRSKPAQN